MPQKRLRVFGPYPSGNRWRLMIREDGHQQALPFDTREQAERAKEQLQTSLVSFVARTVGDAIKEYLLFKQERGCKPRSIKTCEEKLKFLPPGELLSRITPERAEKLYRAQTERVSVATHHKNLRDARALFEYCVEKQHIPQNPWKGVRPIGKAKTGKLQLRRDEAKKLSALLLRHAADGDRYALALTVQVLFGLRSAEVLNLRKRDLDADGTLLVVEGTKTQNARRSLSLESPVVRELLQARVARLAPDALIFGRDGSTQPLSTTVLFKQLHKFCKLADVPLVCPHSLRGLHSSLAIEGGATSAIVAAALGHGSDAITLKHYISESAVDTARASRVAAALFEPDVDQDMKKLISTLRALSPEKLQRVLRAVGSGS